jgi:hypothetical protein
MQQQLQDEEVVKAKKISAGRQQSQQTQEGTRQLPYTR